MNKLGKIERKKLEQIVISKHEKQNMFINKSKNKKKTMKENQLKM